LSFSHLLIVFLIALVAFGPQKLPELARALGKAMAEFRKASNELRSAMEEEMRELEHHTKELERRSQQALFSGSAGSAAPPEHERDPALGSIGSHPMAAPEASPETPPAPPESSSTETNSPDAHAKPV